MKNKLRELHKAQKQALGTFFNAGDMSCMECIGYSGLDFVIIDAEHGPYDTESIMNLIRASESVGLTPVVRIADVTHKEIQRVADCGAEGLIVPCLRTVEEYKKLVDLAKYAPIGNRGFIKGRGSGFGNMEWASGSIEEFMANSNEKLMVIPQCETAESLECIEEIAAIDGVDGIFIGPFDLSISMGIPAKFQLPEFKAAIKRIVDAFHKEGKPAYIFANNAAETRGYLADGIDGVATGLSSVMLAEAYKKLVAEIKA